jgi:hypothetical protein
MSDKFRKPSPEDQAVLDGLLVRLLEPHELEQSHQLLDRHHYLQSPKPVGERLDYVVTDPVLSGNSRAREFHAASR